MNLIITKDISTAKNMASTLSAKLQSGYYMSKNNIIVFDIDLCLDAVQKEFKFDELLIATKTKKGIVAKVINSALANINHTSLENWFKNILSEPEKCVFLYFDMDYCCLDCMVLTKVHAKGFNIGTLVNKDL